jgi:catechol 2,3-dioxygenase-like lactoylglutathione lyase family enzyme
MTALRICIDVPELERGIAFYSAALGLAPGRRLGDEWVELTGAPVPVDLLRRAAGTAPTPGPAAQRDFGRHWTPLHLDVVVPDLDEAVARAVAAGARLEQSPPPAAWGRMANLADPFGHGFCLLEFRGRGYDEVLAPAGA